MPEGLRVLRPVSSLQARLMLATCVLAVAAVIAVAFAARLGTRREFVKLRKDLALSAARVPSTDPAAPAAILEGTCCGAERLATAATLLQPREVLVVFDPEGRQVAITAGTVAAAMRELQVTVTGDVLTLSALSEKGAALEHLVLQYRRPPTSVTLADGRRARLYVLPVPTPEPSSAEVFLQSVDRRLVLATALIGILAVATTWLVTRRALRPVRALQEAARAIARGDFTARVSTAGPDELAELARGFNTMAGELQRQKALRERLVHDVVHELRTPLTGLRCRIESMVDGMAPDPRLALEGASEDVSHLTRLVGDLHEISLAEANELRLDVGQVDVGPLLASAVRGTALDGDPRLQTEGGDGLVVRADPVRARQVVMNLLTNASRHTPAGGSMVLSATGQDREVHIEVRNTGSTLTDDQLAHVFDRFYRVDPSRQRSTGGTGLGLAIVRTLVNAQGGRVWASATADSVTVGFALPMGSDSAASGDRPSPSAGDDVED
ncbi:hypothetical protein TBR22_A00770 [Luteitalea sp. TBR-22]|uniref:sensor histidine kinase n=1 Tax=Luteitalea sp. TBR-22 TaxID=2802971 RepID=UPI001AF47516|nr:ATP-binding protein [Luteitalea sp. TBR-22]BCS30877.1 hypothetical protein TBR22_A00770 [Luteitalea sp. TBR-22]